MQFESVKICRKTVHTVPVNLINPMKTQPKCIYKTVRSMLQYRSKISEPKNASQTSHKLVCVLF